MYVLDLLLHWGKMMGNFEHLLHYVLNYKITIFKKKQDIIKLDHKVIKIIYGMIIQLEENVILYNKMYFISKE